MGWFAVAAGLTFGAGLAFLSLFFVTRNERFDRVAEWAFIAFSLSGIATIVTTVDRTSSTPALAWLVAGVGIAGAAVMGLSELLVTLRLIKFRRVAMLQAVAFVGVLAWIAGVSILTVAGNDLPTSLGWLGVLAISVGLGLMALLLRDPAVIRGNREPDRSLIGAFLVIAAAIVTWMVWLGLSV